MFRSIKRLVDGSDRQAEALERLAGAFHGVVTDRTMIDGLSERVAALEASLTTGRAEAEATKIKAESTLKAARAAEERARRYAQTVERAEEGPEELDEEVIRAYQDAGILPFHGQGGEEEPMPPVLGRVEARASGRQAAKAMKWSRR